jgi:hypothetical protein
MNGKQQELEPDANEEPGIAQQFVGERRSGWSFWRRRRKGY